MRVEGTISYLQTMTQMGAWEEVGHAPEGCVLLAITKPPSLTMTYEPTALGYLFGRRARWRPCEVGGMLLKLKRCGHEVDAMLLHFPRNVESEDTSLWRVEFGAWCRTTSQAIVGKMASKLAAETGVHHA